MKIKDTVHFEWYKHLFIALLLLAFLYASIVSTDANFEQLAGNIGQVGVFLKKLAHPQSSYLPKLVDPMVKTLKMSALGTALGILLAIPFAFLATTVVTDNRSVPLLSECHPHDSESAARVPVGGDCGHRRGDGRADDCDFHVRHGVAADF